MKEYTLKLQLISPTLIGSGEGFGAVIDTDVVFDDAGLPFVPAKRIKGCLRDAALEVQEMFERAKISYPIPIEQTFGTGGQECSAPVYFSNLILANSKTDDSTKNHGWLTYFLHQEEYHDILSREKVLETFTEIRQQTAIEKNGVAKDTSLRTIRVLKKGLTFAGAVSFDDEADHKNLLTTLLLACANFRAMGTKRNRGFGEVRCVLVKNGQELSLQERWEAITNDVPLTI